MMYFGDTTLDLLIKIRGLLTTTAVNSIGSDRFTTTEGVVTVGAGVQICSAVISTIAYLYGLSASEIDDTSVGCLDRGYNVRFNITTRSHG
jgi:hypothetical protein